jgi:hypothetical protein
MRFGEMAGLKWTNVNLKTFIKQIERTFAEKSGG